MAPDSGILPGGTSGSPGTRPAVSVYWTGRYKFSSFCEGGRCGQADAVRRVQGQLRALQVRAERRGHPLHAVPHQRRAPAVGSGSRTTRMADAFADIAGDRDIKVGDPHRHRRHLQRQLGQAGDRRAQTPLYNAYDDAEGVANMDEKAWYGRKIIENLLAIDVPMIAAVNGPCTMHSEVPLLMDIVLASDDAYFQDLSHFPRGMVPGDGQHVVWDAARRPEPGPLPPAHGLQADRPGGPGVGRRPRGAAQGQARRPGVGHRPRARHAAADRHRATRGTCSTQNLQAGVPERAATTASRPRCGRSASSSRSVPACRRWTGRGTRSRGPTDLTPDGAVTTTDTKPTVQWPAWENAAFYNQDPEAMYASIAAQRQRRPGVLVRAARLPDRPLGAVEVGAPALRRQPPRAVLQPVRVRHRRRQRSVDGDAPAARSGRRTTLREGEPDPGRDPRGRSPAASSRWAIPNFESLILADPPRHGQIRNILMKALRPSLVRSLKARIAEIADEFLDEIEPGAETDFVTTVGQIPAALMTELIGVPRDMRERFIEMASAQMQADHDRPEPRPRRRSTASAASCEEFHAYCDELLAERRASGAETATTSSASSPARSYDGGPVPARHGDLVHPHVRQRRRDDAGRSSRSSPWRWPSTPTSGASSSSGPS